MAIKFIVLAFEAKIDSPASKLVLLKLADNANDAGICWPAVLTIAEQTSLSERTVREHIQRLADLGFIEVIRRRDGDTNLSNYYRLKLRGDVPGVQEMHQGVRQQMPEGGAPPAVPLVQQPHPNRHIEPSIEPSEDSASPSRAAATTLPANWACDLDYAKRLGIPENVARSEAEKFKGYFVTGRGSGKRRTPKGWRQSWMNWIGKATERGFDGPSAPTRPAMYVP